MAQNLPAPCYQVYAASVLASLPFRQADLATRGLIHTMQLECWVNHRLPSNPAALAKVLGFDAGEITAALPFAMTFFSIDGESIFSPQLEDYRTHLNEIRAKQKTGGKKGADITNGKKGRAVKNADIELEADTANPQVHPQVEARVLSKAKSSTAKQSQNQPPERAIIADQFVAEYEAAEANEYARASKGA
jgi:uncharacterized protein YdaU (DUF1376 family)